MHSSFQYYSNDSQIQNYLSKSIPQNFGEIKLPRDILFFFKKGLFIFKSELGHFV